MKELWDFFVILGPKSARDVPGEVCHGTVYTEQANVRPYIDEQIEAEGQDPDDPDLVVRIRKW